jgi:hypothetical protein
MDRRTLCRFVVVCRVRESADEWAILSRHELEDQALSAADVYASSHMDRETGVFELTTIMRSEIVTRVQKF